MGLFGRPTAADDRKAQAWAAWFAQRNPLAIASLVLGIFSLIEFGALIVFGVAGIVLGTVALWQLRRGRDAQIPEIVETHQQTTDHRLHSGTLEYADARVLNGVDRLRYEKVDAVATPSKGQMLAWFGIAMSGASLVIAVLLYLRIFG